MGASGRGDRQRISLLPPVGSSVTSIPSPSAAAASDYQQHAAAARNPPRVGLMPVQPDQYCSRTPVDMSSLQQDAPPFKKIRLGPHQQIQQLQSQPQSRCLSPADSCGGKQEQQQHVVQLQQPLRIDTRVGMMDILLDNREISLYNQGVVYLFNSYILTIFIADKLIFIVDNTKLHFRFNSLFS